MMHGRKLTPTEQLYTVLTLLHTPFNSCCYDTSSDFKINARPIVMLLLLLPYLLMSLLMRVYRPTTAPRILFIGWGRPLIHSFNTEIYITPFQCYLYMQCPLIVPKECEREKIFLKDLDKGRGQGKFTSTILLNESW